MFFQAGDQEVPPDVIGRALKYLQAQVIIKPVIRSTVTINLSTGLPEEPPSPTPLVQAADSSIETQVQSDMPASPTMHVPAPIPDGCGLPDALEVDPISDDFMQSFSEEDLEAFDLGGISAPLNPSDLDLVMMSP